MLNKNQILVFAISFLIAGFFLLSTPESGFSGNGGLVCCSVGSFPICAPPGECSGTPPACESVECSDPEDEGDSCECTTPEGACCLSNSSCERATEEECDGFGGVWQGPDTICADVTCPQPPPPPIPTLNQWGMIIMAAVLGLFAVIGLFVMRRGSVVMPSS